MVSVRTVTPAGPSKSSECGIVPNASMTVTAAYAAIPMRRTPELIASARPLRVLSFNFRLLFSTQYSERRPAVTTGDFRGGEGSLSWPNSVLAQLMRSRKQSGVTILGGVLFSLRITTMSHNPILSYVFGFEAQP